MGEPTDKDKILSQAKARGPHNTNLSHSAGGGKDKIFSQSLDFGERAKARGLHVAEW